MAIQTKSRLNKKYCLIHILQNYFHQVNNENHPIKGKKYGILLVFRSITLDSFFSTFFSLLQLI